MKKLLAILSISSLLIFMNSCGGEEPIEETTEIITEGVIEETTIDNPNAEETAADTSSSGVYQEEVDENEKTSLQDAMSNTTTEEVVEKNGLSFCDCVKKQKELSDLIIATEEDAEFDKAMADLETMKTGDCKILFAAKQNNIDEKRAHERKVKNCLGK